MSRITRSSRMLLLATKDQRQTPMDEARFFCKSGLDPGDSLIVAKVNKYVGKGVFANKNFKKGDFLVEYRGERLSRAQFRELEERYNRENLSYVFEFYNGPKKEFIDATNTDSIARYLNDICASKANAQVKRVFFDDKAHLVFFASRDIHKGQEIRYDYGVPGLEWRKRVNINEEIETGSSEGSRDESDEKSTLSQNEISGSEESTFFAFHVKDETESVSGTSIEEHEWCHKSDGTSASDGGSILNSEGDTVADKKASEETGGSGIKEPEWCHKSDGTSASDGGAILNSEGDTVADKNADEAGGNSLEEHEWCQKSDGTSASDGGAILNSEGCTVADKNADEDGGNSLEEHEWCQKSDGTSASDGGAILNSEGDILADKKASEETGGNSLEEHELCHKSDCKDALDLGAILDSEGDTVADKKVSEEAGGNSIEDQESCHKSDCKGDLNGGTFPETLSGSMAEKNVEIENDTARESFHEQHDDTVSNEPSIFENVETEQHTSLSYQSQHNPNDKSGSGNFTILQSEGGSEAKKGSNESTIPDSEGGNMLNEKIAAESFGSTESYKTQHLDIHDPAIRAIWCYNSGLAVPHHKWKDDPLGLETAELPTGCLDHGTLSSTPQEVTTLNADVTKPIHPNEMSPIQFIAEDSNDSFNNGMAHQEYVYRLVGLSDKAGNVELNTELIQPLNLATIALPDLQTHINPGLDLIEEPRGERQEAEVGDDQRETDNGKDKEKRTKPKEKYRKPDRPCPYCKKLVCGGKLRRHIGTVHKYEEDVAANLSNKKLDAKFFHAKRLEGIRLYNKKLYEEKNPSYCNLMRERKVKEGNENKLLKMCEVCYKFIGSATFYKHKCDYTETNRGTPLLPRSLVETELHTDEEFRREVLRRFRDDDTGKLCRTNKIIKEMGYRIFCKRRHEKAKMRGCRKTSMTEMRTLANIFQIYQRQEGAPENAVIEDMFRSGSEQTEILYEAIREYGTKIETGKLKHGAMLNLKAVIRRTSKHIRALYDERSQKGKAEDIEAFMRQLSFRDPQIFGAAHFRAYERTFELRRPSEMPSDERIIELHSFIKGQIESISNNFDITKYVALRNLVVSRLTLYNARRGEEGTQMRLKDWADAKQKVWMSEECIEKVSDPAEKFLANQFLLAYISGKGKKFVPILVPIDCIDAIDILVDRREEYGICKGNIFTFASKGSFYNCSGWHAVRHVMAMKPGPSFVINATLNRHRVSSMYTALDMTPAHAKIYFQHLSHSEDVSRENYRCPPGVKETLIMAPILNDISEGRKRLNIGAPGAEASKPTMLDVAYGEPVEKKTKQRHPHTDDDSDSDSSESSFYIPYDGEASESESRSILQVPKRPKRAETVRWSAADTDKLATDFSEFMDEKCKVFPTKKKIEDYLKESPLQSVIHLSPYEQYFKVRTKIINEKKTRIQRLKKHLISEKPKV